MFEQTGVDGVGCVGANEGDVEGLLVGFADGLCVGCLLGDVEGEREGVVEGLDVGLLLGVVEGFAEGLAVGLCVNSDGDFVGLRLGDCVGTGCLVGA